MKGGVAIFLCIIVLVLVFAIAAYRDASNSRYPGSKRDSRSGSSCGGGGNCGSCCGGGGGCGGGCGGG